MTSNPALPERSYEDRATALVEAYIWDATKEQVHQLIDEMDPDDLRALSLTLQRLYRWTRDAWLTRVTTPKEQE